VSRKNPTPDGPPRPEPAPQAAGDVPDLREALDLWREDAARTAARLDVTGALAERIVAEAATERNRPLAVAPAGARWYAAAAVLLIAVGIAGTLLARQAAAQEQGGAVRFVDIEEALVQVLTEAPELSPGLEGR